MLAGFDPQVIQYFFDTGHGRQQVGNASLRHDVSHLAFQNQTLVLPTDVNGVLVQVYGRLVFKYLESFSVYIFCCAHGFS
jgi:hypothetical protein